MVMNDGLTFTITPIAHTKHKWAGRELEAGRGERKLGKFNYARRPTATTLSCQRVPPLFVKEVVEALLNRMKVELELAEESGGGSAEWGREGGAAVVATRYEAGQLMGSGCVADEGGAVG